MKCSNPQCLQDAKLMPRIKRRPVAEFIDQALIVAGITRQMASESEDARRMVLHEARRLTYQAYPRYAVCHDCVPWAHRQFPVETRALQMVPIKSRIVRAAGATALL